MTRHGIRRGNSKGGAAKKIAIAVAVFLGVVVVYCALLVNSALQVKRHVGQAVSIVQSASIGSDVSSAVPALADKTEQVRSETKAARSQTDGMVWRISTLIPYFGDDFSAVRTAVTALDTMAGDVVPDVADALQELQRQDIASEGTLNVAVVSSVADTISRANTSIQQQSEALENAPEPHIGKVRDAMESGIALFGKVAEQSGQLAKVASMISQLVDGGEGKYLIMVQGNAETEAAGGVPGSIGSLEVNDGRISVGEFHSDSEFQIASDVEGSEQINQMYVLTQFEMGDIRLASASPDFMIVAKYVAGSWNQQSFGSDDTIKGVMSLDPYALQSMLGVLGGVTLSNGVQLDGSNTAQYLSNTVYRDIPDQNQQDAFFKESAQLIMQKAFGSFSADNMLSLVKTMATLGRQRHIYNVSFADSGESGWNGELSDDPRRPETGLFVNEMGWSKMDWYAKRSAVVSKTKVNQDGTATWHVSYTITNSMDPADVESTPEYITGTFPTSYFERLIEQGNRSDEERSLLATAIGRTNPGVFWNVYAIESPVGGSVSNIKVSNNSASSLPEGEQFNEVESDGRTYYTNVGVFIDPGCTAVVEYDVTTAAGASDLKLDETPVPYEPQIVYEDKTKE